MSFFDKMTSAVKKVSDLANELTKDDEMDEEEDGVASAREYTPPKYDALRPLVRTALMKDETSERDMELMKRKATALGMDADEFEMRFEALVTSKNASNKKNLLGKKVNNGAFFKEDDLEEETPFDKEFDQVFLTAEERHNKARRAAKEEDEDLKSLGGIGGISSLLGGL